MYVLRLQRNCSINKQQKDRKSSITWRFNTTLLNNTWVKTKISLEIEKYFEINKNEKTTY